MTETGKIIGLKCPNCGGPLPESDKDLQKCSYCNMTIHIEDANKYLNHLKGLILEWMRTALPLGVGTEYSSSVDPLARHNIFVYNILPRLNSEFGVMQINAYEAFSRPLLSPPYVKYPYSAKQMGDSKSLFSYGAKIVAVQPFAISDEDKTSIQKMGGISSALAHILIGLELLSQNQVNNYKIVAENFSVAAKALEAQYKTLSERLRALSEICIAIDEIFSKKTLNAKLRITKAKTILEGSKEKSTFDLNLSLCTNAIEEEIQIANSVDRIADIIEYTYNKDLEVLNKIRLFFETASNVSNNVPLNWKSKFEDMSRYAELLKWVSLILEAKMGRSSIKVASGPGNVLFPFWIAEIKYTFGTGALWMKKGVCVSENALIAATFPLNYNFSSSPADVLTDIFSERPYGTFGSSILGSEASISVGQNINWIVNSARLSSVSGYKVIPPLSTIHEAKQLIDEYIRTVSIRSNGKMHVASCGLSDLLFIPADSRGNILNFITLGNLQPKNVGNLSVLNSLCL